MFELFFNVAILDFFNFFQFQDIDIFIWNNALQYESVPRG